MSWQRWCAVVCLARKQTDMEKSMDHYLDIRLLPDPEFKETVLMNALFAKLHRALVQTGQGEIGVSFPGAGKDLGDTLRLHGNRNALSRLMELGWIKGLRDYSDLSSIKPVPNNCRYRIVKRVQSKSSVARLYRRSVRKGWMTLEEAEKKIADHKVQLLKQPYVQVRSKSSGQFFRLFVQQEKCVDSPCEGTFSAYGLSGDATIPWF